MALVWDSKSGSFVEREGGRGQKKSTAEVHALLTKVGSKKSSFSVPVTLLSYSSGQKSGQSHPNVTRSIVNNWCEKNARTLVAFSYEKDGKNVLARIVTDTL